MPGHLEALVEVGLVQHGGRAVHLRARVQNKAEKMYQIAEKYGVIRRKENTRKYGVKEECPTWPPSNVSTAPVSRPGPGATRIEDWMVEITCRKQRTEYRIQNTIFRIQN